jgi:cell shape-determining protein MreD
MIMETSVDLSGGWSTFWNAVTSSAGTPLTGILSVLGVCVLVFTLASYFWQRARGQGHNDSGKLVWALAVGAVLAAPGVIFPLILGLMDMVANAVISIYQATM